VTGVIHETKAISGEIAAVLVVPSFLNQSGSNSSY